MPAMETQGVRILRATVDNPTTPEHYALIGRIVNFDGPGGSASEIDASDLQSAAKEFLIGLRDEGTFSFEMNMDVTDAQQAGLRADRENRTLRNFRVVLTDDSPPTNVDFTAYVMEFRISGGVDQLIKANATLRISGAVDWGD